MANFKDFSYALSDLSDISEILPFIIWLLFAKKKMPFIILGVFFAVSGAIKIFTLVTAEVVINNMPAYHLLAFVEIMAFYCFYSVLIFKRVNPIIITVIFLLYAANTYYIQSLFTFNSLAWVANVFLILVTGLLYFFKIYKSEDYAISLEKRPDFIITTGWLIYASGSLFPYLLVTDIITGKPQGFFNNGWIYQNISNFLKNIIICYGLLLTKNECLN